MRLLLVFFGITSFLASLGQNQIRIRGTVTDTAEKKSLALSSVVLLQAKDSILVGFTRTDAQGRFELTPPKTGAYILLVTFPRYADFSDVLSIKDSADVQLPPVPMILRSQLLQEVVFTHAKGAIRMKGDTTEFKADSFKVQAGANVEDLLKKLPGIQVDKNGNITAQGERVKKVLVDGEEFFGDDPTLVTQNLRADMVDKVQVYDKKSDQANFTGIDDGTRDKTINLQLKEDKKNGYFGKLEAGAGTQGYYNTQAMYNWFKKKKKFSVYGIASNTGKTGLNWQENNSYGQRDNVDYSEGEGFSFSNNSNQDDLESWSGQYEGKGYPTVLTAGAHYNDKWNADHHSLNLNYKILQLQVTGQETSNSQTILPDSTFFTNTHKSFRNQILRNRTFGTYEFQIDSSSSIKVNAAGAWDHKTTAGQYLSESLKSDSSQLNRSSRQVGTNGDIHSINSDLTWRKKFQKKGRTLSVAINENFTGNLTDGSLVAENDFFSGSINPKQIIDQHKHFDNKDVALTSRIAYSEPLSNRSAILINYGMDVSNSTSDRQSYSKDSSGKYTQLDSLYSNDYLFNVWTNHGGLNYHLGNKKFKLNAGSDVGITRFRQMDVEHGVETNRSFVNWYPRANASWNPDQTTRLGFYYDGRTDQPSIQQIQPIANNEDPLNILVGNPALKPSFTNNFTLYFNSFQVLSERYMYANVGGSTTSNAITSSDVIDSSGRKISQYVNVNGNYNLNAYLGYYLKLKKLGGLGIDIGPSFNTNRYANIVNHVDNVTTSNNYQIGFSVNKDKEKKYSLSAHIDYVYTQSTSSIQSTIQTHYHTWNVNLNGDLYLPWHMQIHSDLAYNFRQKTSLFSSDVNVFLWNAWIGRKFLKNDAMLVKVSGNDLLNQNIGFNRSVSSNYISQNTYTTIQRYFMLSAVWNFNKAGTPAPKND